MENYTIQFFVPRHKPMTQQVAPRATVVIVSDASTGKSIAIDYMRTAHKSKLEAIRILEKEKIGTYLSFFAIPQYLILNVIGRLEIGEKLFLPESDYGFGEVIRISENEFECYSIPEYGGNPSLEKTVSKEEVLPLLASWT